jgi:hypothetical protein
MIAFPSSVSWRTRTGNHRKDEKGCGIFVGRFEPTGTVQNTLPAA